MADDLIPPSPRYDPLAEPPPDDAAFFASDDPLALFRAWFAEAKAKETADPNAMSLATVDAEGRPDVRIVLVKEVDARGFTFHSNGESAKGVQLEHAPYAALAFHWKSLGRQVRVRGPVEKVSAAEADAYFATRDRGARLGAWASAQSRPLDARTTLQDKIKDYAAQFGDDVPRPAYWGGWRVRPVAIEFWQNRPFRLHDRLQFHRDAPESAWGKRRLYP